MTSSTSERRAAAGFDGAGLTARLRGEAQALGFVAFGVADADAAPEAAARLRAWLADGCHGDMLWMADTAERRAAPKALWPDVRSVIMLGLPYTPPVDPLRHASAPEVGVVSVYALGQDYHDLLKSRLKALARWLAASADCEVKVFVDTAPVMEKPLAAAAGLGWQGKHSNLISRDHGNWLFLGAIYTTLALPPTAPRAGSCGTCARCIAACPTAAIIAPYRVDARRCISYLTIEHRGPIPHEHRRAIGNRVYGCDDCLAVCPWNRFAHAASAFQPRAELLAPDLGDLLALDDAAFRQVFAGSPAKRIGRARMVRNAAVAAGNSGAARFIPALARLRADADPAVAEAAEWALAELAADAPASAAANIAPA